MSAGKFNVVGTTGDIVTIPAPSTGRIIRIKNIFLSVSAASTITFVSNSIEVGRWYGGTGSPLQAMDNKEGVIEGLPGQSLVINSSAGTIGGFGTYEVVGG
jgi:hypothetical protein